MLKLIPVPWVIGLICWPGSPMARRIFSSQVGFPSRFLQRWIRLWGGPGWLVDLASPPPMVSPSQAQPSAVPSFGPFPGTSLSQIALARIGPLAPVAAFMGDVQMDDDRLFCGSPSDWDLTRMKT